MSAHALSPGEVIMLCRAGIIKKPLVRSRWTDLSRFTEDERNSRRKDQKWRSIARKQGWGELRRRLRGAEERVARLRRILEEHGECQ